MNKIINIIGGEPTQYTQLMDMCVDYVLKILEVNPNEMKNMKIYNMKKKGYDASFGGSFFLCLFLVFKILRLIGR